MNETVDVKLGQRVRHKISGLIGVTDNVALYLNGIRRFDVQPPVNKEGKVPDSQTIDEPELEILDDGKQVMVAIIPNKALIELGEKIEDTITGVKGTAVGICTYMSGCIRVLLTPSKEKDKAVYPKSTWIDQEQLKVLEDAPARASDRSTGGPAPCEPNREY